MDYFDQRRRQLADRAARLVDSDDTLALNDEDLLLRVPCGWRRLVAELHQTVLMIDPRYCFKDAYESHGELIFEGDVRPDVIAVVDHARTEARATCVVCGSPGAGTRPHWPKPLCADCLCNDRAVARAHGERYANFTLLYLMSCDPDHPSPEDIEGWANEREA